MSSNDVIDDSRSDSQNADNLIKSSFEGIKKEIESEHQKVFEAIDLNKERLLHKNKFIKTVKGLGIDVSMKYVHNQIEEWFSNTLHKDALTFEEFADRLSQSDSESILYKAMTGNISIPDWKEFCRTLVSIFEDTKSETGGRNATYIPQLEKVDSELFGLSVCTVDGQIFSYGDASIPFCLQSCSKPLTYLLALEDNGEDEVHARIGREPSGVAFNSFTLNSEKKPHNPMINAGAIMCCSLIKSKSSAAEKFSYLMNFFSKLAGGSKIGFNQTVYLSEKETADRNFALGYFMQSNHVFEEGVNLIETLEFYFQVCSAETNCTRLAVMASTLANNGICPLTGDEVAQPKNVRSALQLMFSCGMYDYSGEWSCTVGIPAKSGVSGAIFLVVPRVMGLAIYSPRLDQRGNSVRGVEFCKKLCQYFAFSIFDQLIQGDEDKIDPAVLSRPFHTIISEIQEDTEDADDIGPLAKSKLKRVLETSLQPEQLSKKLKVTYAENYVDTDEDSLLVTMTPASSGAFLKLTKRAKLN